MGEEKKMSKKYFWKTAQGPRPNKRQRYKIIECFPNTLPPWQQSSSVVSVQYDWELQDRLFNKEFLGKKHNREEDKTTRKTEETSLCHLELQKMLSTA